MKSQASGVQLIREYRAQDFDKVWQIDQTCFPHGVAYTQMELTGFIAKRKAITLVAEAPALGVNASVGRGEGTDISTRASPIVGFVVALPIRGQIGHVVTLDVVPEARRFGLASRLMSECERRLRAAGCKLAYLETAVNNEPALRLYRKLGYKVLRTLPRYYSSQSLDAFQMVKHL
jgi:[ribosomal protein S18]-alanine N-acetyltransferase